MKHLGEQGVSSLLGIVLLGVMMLGTAGLFYAVRNDATASQRYEDEVRLRLAAKSAVEREAVTFERGGERAHMDDRQWTEHVTLSEETAGDDISCRVVAYWEQGELIVSATASMEPTGRRFSTKEYQRVRARLQKSEEGDHYVWLGWTP